MKKVLAVWFAMLLAVPTVHAQSRPQLPPPPGMMVDVGGYDLHLYCAGKGSPTVVMDAGLGDWSLHFRALQENVAEFTRVCTFDRAGYGWSSPGPGPRTSQQNVDELKTLLQKAGIDGPYVLVGHSYGGLNMILFANENPKMVAGVVLLDASHPDQTAWLAVVPEIVAVQDMEIKSYGTLANASVKGKVGAAAVLPNAPQGIPEGLRETWAEQFIRPSSLLTAVAEYAALEPSMARVRAHGSLGDTPLTVIAHGLKLADVLPTAAQQQLGLSKDVLDKYEAIWRGLQEDHLKRSSRSKLLIARHSDHYVYFGDQELVASAIRELVEAAE